MLQPLSYRHIAGHLVPGIVMFGAIILIRDKVSNFAILKYLKFNPPNFLLIGVIILVASVTLGLFVDGIRFGIEGIIKSITKWSEPSEPYAGVNEKNFELFRYVYENSYPFYQLYSNMCISLFVLAFALPWYLRSSILDTSYKHAWWIALIVVLVALWMHLLAAVRSLKSYHQALSSFFRRA